MLRTKSVSQESEMESVLMDGIVIRLECNTFAKKRL